MNRKEKSLLNLKPFQDEREENICEGIPVNTAELDEEYEIGLKLLKKEQEKIRRESFRKPRRKIPKPGCYPQDFSEFTMKRVSTISISELRKDMLALQSAPNIVSCEEKVGVIGEIISRDSKKPRLDQFAPRICRRKLDRGDYLPPRSAAEEKRQMQEALRLSVQGHPCVAPAPAISNKVSKNISSREFAVLNHNMLASTSGVYLKSY